MNIDQTTIPVITASRYHDFSCGHRVVGHESKCAHMHGHNYRVHFECAADQLDSVGRIVDFSVIKTTLCDWLENYWDHKFLVWQEDTELLRMVALLNQIPPVYTRRGTKDVAREEIITSFVLTTFNPTAENMAYYLLTIIGPQLLPPGVMLTKVIVEETRKCQASATWSG